MADHPRKVIRDTVVAILKGKIPEIGDRVFKSRPLPFFLGELPALAVYIPDEAIQRWSDSPTVYKRKPRVIVEVVVNAAENCDDAMDKVCDQVEQLLLANPYLQGPTTQKNASEEEIELLDQASVISGESANILGATRVPFTAVYFTEIAQDVESLDDFDTGRTTYDSGSQSGVAITDEVDISQE